MVQSEAHHQKSACPRLPKEAVMARKNAKDRGIVFKQGAWWVRLWANGREKWYRADNKTQAKVLYGRLKAEIREGKYSPEKFNQPQAITLRAWISRYLESSTHRGLYNERINGRRWSLLLGTRLLTQITTEDLRHIQAQMKARRTKIRTKAGTPPRAWSDATINRHFAFLRHLPMLAVKDGKLARNPVSGIRFFPEAQRTRFLTGEELQQLKGVMRPADWLLVAFAIETGLRRLEQFHLRWDQVSLESNTLTISLPKGGRTRHVLLSEGAKAILRSFDSFLRSAWVFPGLHDVSHPMDSRAFLRRAFEPGLRQAGIQRACWHTLRHTAASHRIMAGVDLVAAKEILGHRDIQTTMRYAHLSPGHLQEAVNRGSVVGTGSKTGSNQQGEILEISQGIDLVARPTGVEPVTPRSVVWCSIH